ncbi:NfeD family protein [Salisediminibacterium halotolerans]|uniref:NfeD family protein n=1 Tax=Salisediminibacterium halotolerans TaxID=517425 RepID=UPI000EB37D41|nr:nodulation protein NfeD [Salisediminibacterium halotolerans]RLJ78160.1 membrane-bound serine protease (ClpP class) [Actinophytocola xinjiangensis]RPE88501.1 membrane-bound serine protease (ClpP class) [Salisediminibacterium halotolerans]TWG37137.1 membrane-bound serine protease (ClpP class) [Salisediminibacterium halotolerans]GEL07275.1 hypothetical protein SHA02_06910 [Salisediminibacterium halotolerans]
MIRWRLLFFAVLLIAGGLGAFFTTAEADNNDSNELVYVIPVEKEVERGLEAFLNRSIETAEEQGADHIIFEVHTPGGFVDAAGNIAALMRNTDVPTTAYVTGDALSAGAYLSLNADEIVMAPGTRMGSAAVIDGSGSAADEKAQSAWLASMREAASLNDRDEQYALAMADSSIDLPELGAGEGELLTLTPGQAEEVGYSEGTYESREDVLDHIGMSAASVEEMETTFAETLARFITGPIVVPILLSLGTLGLVLELFSPGFGIFGILGASSLALFFFGHLVAGFAGLETVILFGAGAVLLLIEIFSPSFGVLGVLGIAAVLSSLVLSGYSTTNILFALAIALVITAVASFLFLKYIGYSGTLKKIVFEDQAGNEQGYVSNTSREHLLGETGRALTILRPSGTAEFNNERLDVVSEGGYIEQGRKVKVVSVSGSKMVVREVKQTEAAD